MPDHVPGHAPGPASSHAPTPGAAIELREVSKRYPGADRDAVTPLSMHIEAGEFVVLLGPSGCGKTTTLRMINRLVEPTSGEIWIDGRNVAHTDPDELRRGIGYVIQQIGLLPHLTIEENVVTVPKLLGWNKQRCHERAVELLNLVGLDIEQFGRRYPRQLSGGQQQRVGVARALGADPGVLLMDEPFGAIDPIAREKLQDEFLALQGRLRKTIVFVTHDLDEALKIADRIAIFAEGSRLAQYATPLENLTAPADDFVPGFVGEGAAVRRLSVLRVADVLERASGTAAPEASAVEVQPNDTVSGALNRVLDAGATAVRVDGRTIGVADLIRGSGRSEAR